MLIFAVSERSELVGLVHSKRVLMAHFNGSLRDPDDVFFGVICILFHILFKDLISKL